MQVNNPAPIIHTDDPNLKKLLDQSITQKITREYQALQDFLAKNQLTPEEDCQNYTHTLKTEKHLGILADAIYNPDQKSITFYHPDSLQYIIHEWIHVLFPNRYCSRHAEGFANYVWNEITTWENREWRLLHFQEIVAAFQNCPYTEPVNDYYAFLREPQHQYDSRLGRSHLYRGLSTLLVNCLIREYGLQEYLKNFYYTITDDQQTNLIEEEKIEYILSELKIRNFDLSIWYSFLQRKQELANKIAAFTKYGLPATGSILPALDRLQNQIPAEAFKDLFKLITLDLKLTANPLQPEKWEI